MANKRKAAAAMLLLLALDDDKPVEKNAGFIYSACFGFHKNGASRQHSIRILIFSFGHLIFSTLAIFGEQ